MVVIETEDRGASTTIWKDVVQRVTEAAVRLRKNLDLLMAKPGSPCLKAEEIRGVEKALREDQLQIKTMLSDLDSMCSEHARLPDDINVLDAPCSKCGSKKVQVNNDVFLCDGLGCNRAYHQRCVDPPIPTSELENEHVYCRRCQTVRQCLASLNEQLDMRWKRIDQVFSFQGGDSNKSSAKSSSKPAASKKAPEAAGNGKAAAAKPEKQVVINLVDDDDDGSDIEVIEQEKKPPAPRKPEKKPPVREQKKPAPREQGQQKKSAARDHVEKQSEPSGASGGGGGGRKVGASGGKKRGRKSAAERAEREEEPVVKSKWEQIFWKVKGELRKTALDRHLISSYQASWKDRGKDLVVPHKDLEQARARVRAMKAAIREVLAEAEAAYQDHGRMAPGMDMVDAPCSKCGRTDDEEGNDMLECEFDGCGRIYHQQCMEPPMEQDEYDEVQAAEDGCKWFCRQCRCLSDCLDLVNDQLHRNYKRGDKLFPEIDVPEGDAWSSEEEESDSDYEGGNSEYSDDVTSDEEEEGEEDSGAVAASKREGSDDDDAEEDDDEEEEDDDDEEEEGGKQKAKAVTSESSADEDEEEEGEEDGEGSGDDDSDDDDDDDGSSDEDDDDDEDEEEIEAAEWAEEGDDEVDEAALQEYLNKVLNDRSAARDLLRGGEEEEEEDNDDGGWSEEEGRRRSKRKSARVANATIDRVLKKRKGLPVDDDDGDDAMEVDSGKGRKVVVKEGAYVARWYKDIFMAGLVIGEEEGGGNRWQVMYEYEDDQLCYTLTEHDVEEGCLLKDVFDQYLREKHKAGGGDVDAQPLVEKHIKMRLRQLGHVPKGQNRDPGEREGLVALARADKLSADNIITGKRRRVASSSSTGGAMLGGLGIMAARAPVTFGGAREDDDDDKDDSDFED